MRITRAIATRAAKLIVKYGGLSSPTARGGWQPLVRESYTGAWQLNDVLSRDGVLGHSAVFSCITLIASDISKLPLRLVRQKENDVWAPHKDKRIDALLRQPNPYQNSNQFWENYFLYKYSNGNVYVLKARDEKNNVAALYVLDPAAVQVLVSVDGEIFYRLSADPMASLEKTVTVPATEIIHDRFNCLWHPLVGQSPILASALAASQGIHIQREATSLAKNRGFPSGVLSLEGDTTDENAAALKATWEANFGGNNVGKIAVLQAGMKFEPQQATAHDSQLVEQLRWTSEVVCSVFHVPPYKIGLGATPAYNNIQALNTEYYSQALQAPIEAAEKLMNVALDLPDGIGTQFDLSGLLRMDTQTQISTSKEAVGAGIMTPNEARARLNMVPVDGGDTPFMQMQNWPMNMLAERDPAALSANGGGDKKPPAAEPEPPNPDNGQKQSTDLLRGFDLECPTI